MAKNVKISRLFYHDKTEACAGQGRTRTVLAEESLLLGSIAAALAGCGLSRDDIERAGIIVGIDSVIDKVKESYFKGVAEDGPIGASPLLFPYTSANVLAARATIDLGIKGPDITIVSGPLSFLKAVSYAFCLVSSGRIKLAIAAGAAEGAAVSMLLGLEKSGSSITDAVESRAGGVSQPDKPASMSETFSLFERALDAGADASIEAGDSSGNVVRIGLCFEKSMQLKEEAFA